MKIKIAVLSVLMYSVSAMAMTPVMYTRVMTAVQQRDLKGLQNLVASGVDVNSPAPNGMTPLCETVWRGDYAGYEMLQSQGGSPYVACMRRLPPERVATFYANQPPAHTYFTGRMGAAKVAGASVEQITFPYLGAGELLLAGAAAGAMVAFGHGNPSSDDPEPETKYNWDAPLSLDASDFVTNEYKSKDIPGKWTNVTQLVAGKVPAQSGINFLGLIHADEAYARGYTGYKVNRQEDGSLIGEGKGAISQDKVKVAVVDEGVWTDHPDLKNNIGNEYNFVYGPCSGSNQRNCWEFKPAYCNMETATGVVEVDCAVLYDASGAAIAAGKITQKEWLNYKRKYIDYVYNSSDANPVSYWVGTNGTSYGRRVESVPVSTTDSGSSSDPDSGSSSDPVASTTSTGSSTAEGATELKWYLVDANGNNVVECESQDKCVYNDVEYEPNYMNHGTHVAGLIGATKNDTGMMGVAYNAEIIPVKIDMATMVQHSSVLYEGLERAVRSADIVNMSIGTTDKRAYESTETSAAAFVDDVKTLPRMLDAFRRAADENKILVFSAGNYDHSVYQAPYDASLYTYAAASNLFNGTTPYNQIITDSDDENIYNLTNLMVSVVSLNRDGDDLESYSAQCGGTMSYCVGAPGGSNYDIFSTARISDAGSATMSETEQNQYGYIGLAGTSMATPIVSGALAVIKGAFPHLTNQQVTEILFATSDYIDPAKTETTYTDYETGEDSLGKYNSIFGRGLINLDKATSPIGLPEIALTTSTTGVKVSASNSSSTISPSMSGLAAVLPTQMIVLDRYQRAFAMPTSSFVHVAKRENKLEGRFKSFMSGDEKVVAKTDKVRMAYTERHSKLSSQMSQGSVSFELKPTSKWQFKSFYTENTETSGGTYVERLMGSPYGKMKEAWGGSVEYSISKNWKTAVQGQVGKNGFVDERDLSRMEHNRLSVFQSSVKYTGLKKVEFKAVAGVAEEQGSLFGMWGRGAFKTGNSQTTYVGAGVALNLTDAIKLEGMYYSGSTKVGQDNSLMHLSQVKSDSFAVAATWQMDDRRTFGLHASSPLRVKSGTARVTLPVARDAYQDIVYQNSTVASLKPSAREYDLGFYYTDAVSDDMLLKSEFGVRLNPDHMAGSAPDWRALVGMHLGL